MKSIPLARPDFNRLEIAALKRVLASGWVVQGPEVEAFEAKLAERHQARHCIAVSSGTAALHLCYLALGIGPGDALFIPSFAWPSAANMAVIVGARPVFVDVLPGTYNIDPGDLRIRVRQCLEHDWGKPRAVVPVHEFGLSAEMDPLLTVAGEYGLDIVEDAACALGAAYHGKPVGARSRMTTFSFHPRKAITTGEGGAIITSDDELAEKCRAWRNHGQQTLGGNREFVSPGLNYRMTDIQAAIGRVQMDKLPGILKRRKELAAIYLEGLSKCPGIELPAWREEHTWQTFMVVLEHLDRKSVISGLVNDGVGAGAGSVAGHRGKFYREKYRYRAGDLPVSLKLHDQGLALPLHSLMSDEDANKCIASCRKRTAGRRRGRDGRT